MALKSSSDSPLYQINPLYESLHDAQMQAEDEFPAVSALPPVGTRDYTILKEVGDGSFGTVWLADWHHPLNLPEGTKPPGPSSRPEYAGKNLVAIKRMKKVFAGGWNECMQLKELKSLRTITDHPNIIPLYDAFLHSTTQELYFVFECMEGNLYQLTKSRKSRPLAGGLVASIFAQMLSGLNHIHDSGFFHRDMKPENLLITTTGLADYPNSSPYALPGSPPEKDVLVILKLADFGLAREISSSPPYTEYVSTRWYRAPEVLLRSRDYSAPVDMWALGTILAELINLKPLFPGNSEVDQIMKICEVLGNPCHDYGMKGGGPWDSGVRLAASVNFAFPKAQPQHFPSLFDSDAVPAQLVTCIAQLLRYEPSARLTTRQCMLHPYFSQVAAQLQPSNETSSPVAVRPSQSSRTLNANSALQHSLPDLRTSSLRRYAPSVAPSHNSSSYTPSLRSDSATESIRSLPISTFSDMPLGHPQHPRFSSSTMGFPESVGGPPSPVPSSMYSFGDRVDGRFARAVRRPSNQASTFYDGSIFEGIAPLRAESVLSFPAGQPPAPRFGQPEMQDTHRHHPYDRQSLQSLHMAMRSSHLSQHYTPSTHSGHSGHSSHSQNNSPSLAYDGAVMPDNNSIRSMDSVGSFPLSLSSVKSGDEQAREAKKSKTRNWMASVFNSHPADFGDSASPFAIPVPINRSAASSIHNPLHSSTSSLARASSQRSAVSVATSPSSTSSFQTTTPTLPPISTMDPKKAKKEAERLAKEAEKARREAAQVAARDRARAVMQKRNQLMQAADPLHGSSSKAKGKHRMEEG